MSIKVYDEVRISGIHDGNSTSSALVDYIFGISDYSDDLITVALLGRQCRAWFGVVIEYIGDEEVIFPVHIPKGKNHWDVSKGVASNKNKISFPMYKEPNPSQFCVSHVMIYMGGKVKENKLLFKEKLDHHLILVDKVTPEFAEGSLKISDA
jgi:hypothetical protein